MQNREVILKADQIQNKTANIQVRLKISEKIKYIKVHLKKKKDPTNTIKQTV